MVKESSTLHVLLEQTGGNKSAYALQVQYMNKDKKKKISYRYVLGTQEEIWQLYIEENFLTICEVIQVDKACHLYLDIDVDLKETPGIDVRECWSKIQPIIVQHMHAYINRELTPESARPSSDVSFNIMDSSSDTKGSLHIVVKVADHLFKNAAHCGAYMRCLQKWIELNQPSLQGHFMFVDMGVYTRNRLFRMLGNTKVGQRRFLTNGKEFTFESWVDARVQPVNISLDMKMIEFEELDHSEPKYSSSSGLGTAQMIVGWVPECVKGNIMKFLCEEVAPINRMVSTPWNFKVICNTTSKECIFQHRTHKSNVNYIVIDLLNRSYHIKCHSAHCKHKRSDKYYFKDEQTQIIDDWMAMTVKSARLE